MFSFESGRGLTVFFIYLHCRRDFIRIQTDRVEANTGLTYVYVHTLYSYGRKTIALQRHVYTLFFLYKRFRFYYFLTAKIYAQKKKPPTLYRADNKDRHYAQWVVLINDTRPRG